MANPINARIVTDIKQRHGSVIDLDKSPHAIIDIIRDFRHVLDEDNGGGGAPGSPGGGDGPAPSPPGGGGAPGSPPGTDGGHGSPGSPGSGPGGNSPGGGGAPGGGGNPPSPRGPEGRDLGMSTMMNIMLDMKREIGGLHAKLDQQAGASKGVSARRVAAPSGKG